MSYRTPVKNSSPLANYSFTTPSSSTSSVQNDTFVQKTKSQRPNIDLIQLAAANNMSTPKRQADQVPKASTNSEHGLFSSPMKLKPMVESPFKMKNSQFNHHQQQQQQQQKQQQSQIQSQQQHNQQDQAVSTSSGYSISLRNLFNQEPGRFRANTTSSEGSTGHLLNMKSTSFEPILDDNVIVAMTRLQNKELSMKKFITSLFGLLVLKLVNSLIKFTYYNTSLLDLVHDKFYHANTVKFTNYFFIVLITINLITTSLQLLQKQDQCLDLNLNNDQRKLLGLELIVDDDDEQDELNFVKTETPVKQILKDQKEIDTIGKTNELLSRLNLSTPRN